MAAAAALAPPPRTAGAEGGLLKALEAAPLSLVGRVGEVRRIDARAFEASLSATTPLSGALERGALLEIAWEELASAGTPRLAEGDHILVSLEKLPADSLWRQRLPDAEMRAQALTIAMRGNAFVKSPAPASVDALEGYLRLPAGDREGASGVAHLVQLAARAKAPLALGALERLASIPHLDSKLALAEAETLMAALLREDTGEAFRARILDLIGDRRLEVLRGPLSARIEGEGNAWVAPPILFHALGRLDGSLPEVVVEMLLARPEVDYRRLGARFAPAEAASAASEAGGGAAAQPQLLRLLRDDPEPAVREAALARLIALRGRDALEPALAALSDPDRGVRTGAAKQVASLGEVAVPGLQAVVQRGPSDAAQAAVASLHLAGPAGRRALAQIAEQHTDPGIRALAALALGQLRVDEHGD